ncbi:nucleoporin POM33 PWA37_002505 [Arxiozyma heterogenica]
MNTCQTIHSLTASERSSTSKMAQSTSNNRNHSGRTNRFLEIVKTLEFFWFSGHFLVTLLSPACFLTGNTFLYRLIYVAVLESFGIILYQHYYLKNNSSFNLDSIKKSLLNDENFYYFILAQIWLFMPANKLSILPYFIFSLFHGLRYLQTVFLPQVFQLDQSNPWIVKIQSFVKNYNERCLYWVASVELVILIQVIFKALLWYERSWICLIIYSIFLKIRYENSKYLTSVFSQWRVRMDGIISHPSIPPTVKKFYNTLKLNLIQLSKYQITPRNSQHAQSTASSNSKKAI